MKRRDQNQFLIIYEIFLNHPEDNGKQFNELNIRIEGIMRDMDS